MKIKSQTGFTLIESLLAIIALALMVFVAFYVYNAQNKSNATLNTAINESTTKPIASQPNYLIIKDLGIKIKLTPTIKGITFTSFTDQKAVSFTDKQFSQAVKLCQNNEPKSSYYFGTLTQYKGMYDPNAPPNNVFGEFVKQLNGFYLEYGNPDGGFCTNLGDQSKVDAVNKIFDQLNPALKDAVKNAQQI